MKYPNEVKAIETLASVYTDNGPYTLARRIIDKDFPPMYRTTLGLVSDAIAGGRTFYSVLSVIRRFRDKQKAAALLATYS